jgi:ankyrin repeat protein
VTILFRKAEEVNKQVGDSQYSPLHYALLYVNVECVDLLVGVNAGKHKNCS